MASIREVLGIEEKPYLGYNEGDFVILRSDFPRTWNRRMERYLGRTVDIRRIGAGGFYITQDEDDRGYDDYIFNWEKDIVRKASPEEVEGMKAAMALAKENARLAKIELMKEMVWTSEGIKRIVLDVFPEERVDFYPLSENNCSVVIHFPEITITNSLGTTHDIKDIFVKFDLTYNNDTGYSVAMSGCRGQISLKEYLSGPYGHSHLNGCWPWGNFCLGSSDFSLIVHQLAVSCREEDWGMLFLSLENYLKWESLEGGPYKKIDQLSYGTSVNTSQINAELERILPLMPIEVFSWNEGVELIETHPSLFNFYNDNSTIKTTSGFNMGQMDSSIADANRRLRQDNRRVKFKGKFIDQMVYKEDGISTNTNIEQDVINQYNSIIKRKLQEHNKTIQYVRAKQLYHETVFGEIGVKQ